VTPAEALAAVRRFGTVECAGDTLKIRVPKGQLADLKPALEALRNAKTEVLAGLAKPSAEAHLQPAEKPEPSAKELSDATALLNRTGVRIMRLEAGDAIGVWTDRDSASIRQALRLLAMDELPIRYLDGPDVPDRYKLRPIPGDPVPNPVREAMEKSSEPWKVRSRMVCNFVPWPLPETKSYRIDPRTGIRPPCEWARPAGAAFVRNARFGSRGRTVIRHASGEKLND
jgi:hypothetical protein